MADATQECRRQWGLLGVLLQTTTMLDALDFLHRAFGASAMRWDLLRDVLSRGETLYGVAKAYVWAKIPPDVLRALREGEKDGRLPERLAELLPEEESGPGAETEASPTVDLLTALLTQAIQKGRRRLVLTEAGTTIPKKLLPALARRLWVMSGQPYWAPKPGTFRMRVSSRTIDCRVSRRSDGVPVVDFLRS